jgi:hypothetical protein
MTYMPDLRTWRQHRGAQSGVGDLSDSESENEAEHEGEEVAA